MGGANRDKKSDDGRRVEELFAIHLTPEQQEKWIEHYRKRHLKDWSNDLTSSEIRQLAMENWYRLLNGHPEL